VFFLVYLIFENFRSEYTQVCLSMDVIYCCIFMSPDNTLQEIIFFYKIDFFSPFLLIALSKYYGIFQE